MINMNKKFIIQSMDREAVFHGHHGQAMIEAQRKADEWYQLVTLKNEKGKVIQNFSPSDYRPQ